MSRISKITNKFLKFHFELKLITLTCSRGILLCTDILSRGIDIENVDWVIQYDPPQAASSFVHRCGRTARCERDGDALIFLLPNEGNKLNIFIL